MPTSGVLFHVDHGLGRAFSWSSVGLAVLTAFLQGLVTAIATMTEQSNRWTFRFRLALYEYWWWTVVSALLMCSLLMNALSFASGTGGEPISVLALSATAFIAIVQYMIPAWQDRHYTRCRWLAWTGDSRTVIPRSQAGFCGNAENWNRLIESNKAALSELQPTPSDAYGWHVLPAAGIPWDPADVLNAIGPNGPLKLSDGDYHTGLYDNGNEEDGRASLKWGGEQHFRRRVSRAVSSMPLGLLKSSPITADGYDGKGLTLAMGILGRNKGLDPRSLVCHMSREISTQLEVLSTWAPRPAKVLRSFYSKTLDQQYSGLGPGFVAAAVELALLLSDMPYWAIEKWLEDGLEHQSLATNQFLAGDVLKGVPADERKSVLVAHYESSYVSMIISLNNMDRRMKHKRERGNVINRPDILCTGLLLKVKDPDSSEPSWWKREDVRERRAKEVTHLNNESHWKQPMARLLGLQDWPEGFEEYHSRWR